MRPTSFKVSTDFFVTAMSTAIGAAVGVREDEVSAMAYLQEERIGKGNGLKWKN